MRIFRALVVDNDEGIVRTAIQVAERYNANSKDKLRLEVKTARGKAQAIEVIKNNFFHAAFIDINLDSAKPEDASGFDVIAELRRTRPSCYRFILTQNFLQFPGEIAAVFSCVNPVAHGISKKDDYEFENILKHLADRWFCRALHVDGLHEIATALNLKRQQRRESPLNSFAEELDYLVSSLLGQGVSANIGVTSEAKEELKRICLTGMGEGRSRSAVARGRPIVGGREGIWCVFKIGPREQIATEYYNYCQYVRYQVSVNRRVELMGHIEADLLGAICYTFAGNSPASISLLAELVDSENDAAIQVLEKLFNHKEQDWYSRQIRGTNIGQYFSSAFKIDVFKCKMVVKEFIAKVKHLLELQSTKDPNELWLDNRWKVTFPETSYSVGRLLLEYHACIVHGDLNYYNIVVGDELCPILIDYQYTSYGPVALDFAALEISVRLSNLSDDNKLTKDDLPKLLGCLETEEKLHEATRALWSIGADDINELAVPLPGSGLEYCGRFAFELQRYFRLNFPGVTQEEYEDTCRFLALRFLSIDELSSWKKLRLLIWISCLKTSKEVGVDT